MAFHLNINFLGLCMFVPDPTPGSMTTSVVMPPMPAGMLSASMPPHVAMLAVDLAFLQPGSTELTGQYMLLSLYQAQLDLQGLGASSSGPPPIPPEIVNLGEIIGKPLHAGVLSDDPSHYLNARILLNTGRCQPKQVQCWTFYSPSSPQPLQQQLLAEGAVWKIKDVEGDSLSLSPTTFGNVRAPLIPTLYPTLRSSANFADEYEVDLVVCNTSPFELPIMPRQVQAEGVLLEDLNGQPGDHFMAFYPLFDIDQAEIDALATPVPCDTSISADTGPLHLHPVNFGEAPYTCMGPAQSAAKPG
jgi:hypothetical protein